MFSFLRIFYTKLGFLKLIIAILATLSFAGAYYSHYKSDWKGKELFESCKNCTLKGYFNTTNCPSITLEKFHITTVTASFSLSIFIIFLTAIWPNVWSWKRVQIANILTDVILCAAIIASACLFIRSGIEIDHLRNNIRNSTFHNETICYDFQHVSVRSDSNFLSGGKIVAGILALMLATVYGMAAVIITKLARNDEIEYIIQAD